MPNQQRAHSRALERAREGIVRVCAQRLVDGSCTASQAKHVIILGDLVKDYFKLTLSEDVVAAEDLRPILAMLPTWAASKISGYVYVIEQCMKPRMSFSQG